MTIPNLGGRNSNLPSRVEMRLTDLERATARIPSRHLNPPLDHRKIIGVAATTAGWAVGTWVKLTGGTWSKAATSSTFAPDALGVVVRVVSSDAAEICTGGNVQLIGTSYTPYTLYYLSTTAGDATSTMPTGANVRQPLFIAYQDGWINILGTAGGAPRSVSLSNLLDVDSASLALAADGDLLAFDFASSKWKVASGGTTSLGTRAAISVVGRAANSSGLAADIAASSTGDVLYMGASSLQWGPLGTPSYGNASVTAAKLGTDVVLNALQDCSVTGAVAGEFLRFNGTAWVNYDLGPIVYDAATTSLALDGGAAGSAIKVLLANATGSRFILSGSGSTGSIEFKLSGDLDLDTEIVARIRSPDSGRVAFYDQGTSAISTGDMVLEWGCNTTYADRFLRAYLPLQVRDDSGTGTEDLILQSDDVETWTLGDSSPSTWLTFLGAGADAYGRRLQVGSDIDLGGGGWVLYANRSAGTLSSRLWVGTSDGVWSQDANITITAPTLLRLTGGDTAATYGRVNAGTSGIELYCSASGTQTGYISCKSTGIALVTSGTNPIAITGPVTMSGDLTVASTRLVVTSTNVSIGLPIVQDASTPTFTMKQSGTTFGLWDTGKIVIGGSAAGAGKAALSTSALNIGGNQVVGSRGSAVTAPSGGATVDSQSRTAINDLISRLQAHGLIA